MPGCTSTFKLQKHHILRRSATGGPTDYITIDGLVVANVCKLCREHHTMVTGGVGGHRLWIRRDWDGWQVYGPSYVNSEGPRTKDGTVWQWVGPLRGNHQ